MTTAPMSAPSSGRLSRRVSREAVTMRSSVGAAVVAVTVPPWSLCCCPRSGRCHVSRGSAVAGCGSGRAAAVPPAPNPGSASAFLRQLLDLLGVLLRHEAGAGVHRLTATEDVTVELVEVEKHDREVTLGVLLLVDREREVA